MSVWLCASSPQARLTRTDYTSQQAPRPAARAGGGGGVRDGGGGAHPVRDHGVRPAGATTLTSGGGGEGAVLERAGPSLRERRKGRGERRREAGRPRAGGQRSAERGPRVHEEAPGPWAPGSSECGRAEPGRAGRRGGEAGLELQAAGRAGGLVALTRGAPRVEASSGEGDGCHGDAGGSGTGCVRGGGARVIRRPLLT